MAPPYNVGGDGSDDGDDYDGNDENIGDILCHWTPIFLKYLSNAEYLIHRRFIRSKSIFTIPSNFAYIWN